MVRTRTSETGTDGAARARDCGFTLLELILVLVVMTLALAVAYPSMSRGRNAFHMRAVARDVIGVLRLARETAVTEQKIMMVVIDSQAQQVTVSDEVGEGARSFHPPADVKVEGVAAAGAAVQGPVAIHFLSNGSAEDAQIVLTSDRGTTMKIVLDPITGLAQVATEEGTRTP
jgi:general secretion pathway protein H